MSFRNLDLMQSAKVLEMYAGFTGILLFTPLFLPEQDRELWQLERSKKTSMLCVYMVRLLPALVSLVLIVSFFLQRMKAGGSQLEMPSMWAGAFTELLFLGGIGFFFSGITNQVVLGYMVAVVYYAANIGAGKYFGKLALFQMMKGQYDFIPWMLCTSLVLYAGTVLLRERLAQG